MPEKPYIQFTGAFFQCAVFRAFLSDFTVLVLQQTGLCQDQETHGKIPFSVRSESFGMVQESLGGTQVFHAPGGTHDAVRPLPVIVSYTVRQDDFLAGIYDIVQAVCIFMDLAQRKTELLKNPAAEKLVPDDGIVGCIGHGKKLPEEHVRCDDAVI